MENQEKEQSIKEFIEQKLIKANDKINKILQEESLAFDYRLITTEKGNKLELSLKYIG